MKNNMKTSNNHFAVTLLILFVPVFFSIVTKAKVPEEVIGINALNYMGTLPLLRDQVICREASTYDRKGGNDNGFTNKAEFLRKEKGKVVAIDAAGPGCIYSFWYSWPNQPLIPSAIERYWAKKVGNANIYFNGGPDPYYQFALKDLTKKMPNSAWPFGLLAKESTGSYITYEPVPFSEGVKISIDGGGIPMFFYHVWYHSYPQGTMVPTWTGKEDLSEVMSKWDPQVVNKPAGEQVYEARPLKVGPNSETRILALKKAGTIKCIRMKLPEDDQLLRSVWLKAYWDNDTAPSVEVPLSLFFSIENRFSKKTYELFQNAKFQSLVVGRGDDGYFYFRRPMPFSKSAELVLENRGLENIDIESIKIEYDNKNLFKSGTQTGYFKTQFRENSKLVPAKSYVLADLSGRGHIVGTVLSVNNASETFLEGDERIYTDGGRSPLVMGDATETYFHGSWYFWGQAFSCPLHGAPTFHKTKKQQVSDPVDLTMYRFHLTDLVPFRDGALFTIQHGPFNNISGHYRSAVFYYGLPKKSLFKTDYLVMSDMGHLESHNFSGKKELTSEKRSGFFEGDKDGQDLGLKKKPGYMPSSSWMLSMTVKGFFHSPPKDSDDLREFTVTEYQDPYEFTVKIGPKSDAVMLRRLFDQSVPDQRAMIEVDGIPAADWFNAGENKWKIWEEDDLFLDPKTTAGKDMITIRVIPKSKTYNAVEYSIFSIITKK